MSDFGEGTPLLQELGVEFTTFDLESFRECRQPFQKVLSACASVERTRFASISKSCRRPSVCCIFLRSAIMCASS